MMGGRRGVVAVCPSASNSSVEEFAFWMSIGSVGESSGLSPDTLLAGVGGSWGSWDSGTSTTEPAREGARVEFARECLGCSRLSAMEMVFPVCLCRHLRENEGSLVPNREPKVFRVSSPRRLLAEWVEAKSVSG
jgi:hypothetical protein